MHVTFGHKMIVAVGHNTHPASRQGSHPPPEEGPPPMTKSSGYSMKMNRYIVIFSKKYSKKTIKKSK